MYVITKHLTFLALDSAGMVYQAPLDDEKNLLKVYEDSFGNFRFVNENHPKLDVIKAHYGYHFFDGQHYLSAEPDKNTISINRAIPLSFETFNFVSCEKAQKILGILKSSAEEENIRFINRVNELKAANLPIKLYCAAGTIPRQGFLNLDIECQSFPFINNNTEDYFLLPFAQMKWSLDDSSVDYIYHEDFIEHIPQIMQIQFLAETYRVLKTGAVHRVSTPNLISSMLLQSNFAAGFEGVYTGELRWGHIALLSPKFLMELAEMVGYQRIIPAEKNQSVSPFFDYDVRPNSDRQWEDGNIFVDLIKY